MDTTFPFQGITFIWDTAKARLNLTNHGLPFEQAVEAFFDPFFKVIDATRNGEARDAVIGFDTRGRLLYVVHLEWTEDAIRLISARTATQQERQHYEK